LNNYRAYQIAQSRKRKDLAHKDSSLRSE